MRNHFTADSRPPLKDVTIIPAPGMVLIRKIEDGIAMKSGIVVPHSERDENYLAEVVAVSPIDVIEYGVVIPKFVSKGAIVVLKTYASGQILSKRDGDSMQLVEEKHIAGVIDRAEYDAVAAKAAKPADESEELQKA